MEDRYVEVLLEDIRGKFDLVIEGHEVLRKEIWNWPPGHCRKVDKRLTVLN